MQLLRLMLLQLLIYLPLQVFAWELKEDVDAVKTFQRINIDGLFQVKAVTEVEANLMSLPKLLDDTEAAPEWIDRCRKVEIVDWFGGHKRLVHSYFSSPWPITDRDMVTSSLMEVSDDQSQLDIEILDKGKERQLLPHYVRMEDIVGLWTVEQLDEKKVRITYMGSGSAAGNLPDWLSNRLMLSSAHKTFVNLRKWVSLEKYQ